MTKVTEFLTYGFNLGIGLMAVVGGVMVGLAVLWAIIDNLVRLANWIAIFVKRDRKLRNQRMNKRDEQP